MLLANEGKSPDGKQIFSKKTAHQVLSIMSTCGLYNDSGRHLVRSGIPSKSSVSGYILAAVPGKAGIATFSPCVNHKGTSVRGELMLADMSERMHWHFADR